LKRLTHLQIEDLQKEIRELQALIDHLEDLLAHHEKILGIIKDETNELADKYGDDRKTDIVADEVEEINTEDMIKEEEVVVMISKMGYIKRVPLTLYKAQSRGGKGSLSANLIEDDYINQIFIATTKSYITFMTDEGKAYWIKVHEIPESSRSSRGSSVKSLLQLSADEEITTIVTMKDYTDSQFIFMATANGVVKKCQTTEFANAKTRGVIAIKLKDGDKLVSSILTSGNKEVMLVTRRGQALRINEEDVRPMGRASAGVTGIRLSQGDELAAAICVEEGKDALVITEKGIGKRVDFEEFGQHGRGTGGQKIFGNTDNKGEIIGAIAVSEDAEVICMTGQGKTLRIKAGDVSKQGRGASGTRVINIDSPDYVVGFDSVAQDKE
ncbi:DNA gyrase C-terminal beta-propeller domain-containing protein, partial [uncultured Treponema sp.]|uniref:DNA gyrase C-terminal beta-propeller domain-containing protein n=1 Tax=uncultured Treponema sp. TaxID=162155 RepID=UPI0025E4BED6